MENAKQESETEGVSLQQVFAAARARKLLKYEPRRDETVIDLISHAGVSAVEQSAVEQCLTMLSQKGLDTKVVAGGFHCLLIRVKVIRKDGPRKQSIDMEIKTDLSKMPANALNNVLKLLE